MTERAIKEAKRLAVEAPVHLDHLESGGCRDHRDLVRLVEVEVVGAYLHMDENQ
jgi:hypothetical protein